MVSASGRSPRVPASVDLIRELRTFSEEIERYISQMSQLHTMHRTDLSAIALIMELGEASPRDISDGLGLSPSATSAVLNRLERAEHVRRWQSATDRRSVRVEVTDQARTVGKAMFMQLAQHVNKALELHDDGELAETAVLIEEINRATRAARLAVQDELDGASAGADRPAGAVS